MHWYNTLHCFVSRSIALDRHAQSSARSRRSNYNVRHAARALFVYYSGTMAVGLHPYYRSFMYKSHMMTSRRSCKRTALIREIFSHGPRLSLCKCVSCVLTFVLTYADWQLKFWKKTIKIQTFSVEWPKSRFSFSLILTFIFMVKVKLLSFTLSPKR